MNKKAVIFLIGLMFVFQHLYAQEETENTQTDTVSAESENYEKNLKIWQGLSEEEKQKLREKAERLKELPEEDKAELKNKLQKLNILPEQERQQVNENFKRFEQLPPEKKTTLRNKVRQIQGLPKERRELMRTKFLRRNNELEPIKPTSAPDVDKVIYGAPILKQEHPQAPEVTSPKPVVPARKIKRQEGVDEDKQANDKPKVKPNGRLLKKPSKINKEASGNPKVEEKKLPAKPKRINNINNNNTKSRKVFSPTPKRKTGQ